MEILGIELQSSAQEFSTLPDHLMVQFLKQEYVALLADAICDSLASKQFKDNTPFGSSVDLLLFDFKIRPKYQ